MRRAGLLGFVLLSIQMPDPRIGAGAAAGALEPVEHLGGRVDLVVVLAFGEDRQLVEVFGKPGRLLWQMHKAVLDHCGLGVHAHDLVRLRLVAGDGVEALAERSAFRLGEAEVDVGASTYSVAF